ncbi:hypothetical protein DL768_000683 [Monosporascus sp. mg162]|nr:hypothetical protein DL768_000683 [Monosporascus sp. mg162]
MATQLPTRQQASGPNAVKFLALPLDIRYAIYGSVLPTPPKLSKCRLAALCSFVQANTAPPGEQEALEACPVLQPRGFVRGELAAFIRIAKPASEPRDRDSAWRLLTSCTGLCALKVELEMVEPPFVFFTLAKFRNGVSGREKLAISTILHVHERMTTTFGGLWYQDYWGDNIYAVASPPVPLELTLTPEDIKHFAQAYRNGFCGTRRHRVPTG